MSWWDGFLNLLFPPKCPICAKVLEGPGICPACAAKLPWTEETETTLTLPGRVLCAAPLWYEDLAREGILRFKFQGASGAARALGPLLAQCAAEQFSGGFDVVTWVPVSGKRLRQRGYDQSELLARGACRLWGTRPQRLLKKSLDNAVQSSLREPAARRANVLGVYQLRHGVDIAGRRVLLVDDICTTGATLTECVRVLREAGAAEVVCVVLARTRERSGAKAGSPSHF